MLDLFENHYYFTYVPLLLYGSELGGFSDLEHIEFFHRKFLRTILKAKSTPNCMIYGDKRGKFTTARKLITECYVSGTKHYKEAGKISHLTYKLAFSMHENPDLDFYSPWIHKIKTCLNHLGFGNIWVAEENCPLTLPAFKALISQRISDINEQQWLIQMNNNKACQIYRIFNLKFRMELCLSQLDFAGRTTVSLLLTM